MIRQSGLSFNEQLTDQQKMLAVKLCKAHWAAAKRQNLSTEVLKASYQGNGGDFLKSAAAAILCLGGLHAPVIQTHYFLQRRMEESGKFDSFYWTGDYIVPGWGNAFEKGHSDPIVMPVTDYIQVNYPGWGFMIDGVTRELHNHNKRVYPNMACVTAVTAIILGMPAQIAPALVLEGRLFAWADILNDFSRKTPTKELRDFRG